MKPRMANLRNNLKLLSESLKNPFIITSLILGILGAPPLYYSGIYAGNGQEALAGLLFVVWVLVYTLDALVTLTLLVNTRR